MSGDIHRHVPMAGGTIAQPERREAPDRRFGIDRRGTAVSVPASPEARPYGFREFDERRCNQDRRLYGIENARFSPADPEPFPCEPVTPGRKAVPFGIVPLSEGELRALLWRADD